MTPADLVARIEANPVEGSPDAMRQAFARRVGHRTDVPLTRIGGYVGRTFGDGPPKAVWLHGGGYVFGSSETHSAAASYTARRMGGGIFVLDYPLAPEAAWADILNSVVEVLEATGPLPLVGDSAGGHLALNVALARRDLITRLALISPNTDRTGSSRTRSAGSDLMNDDAGDERLARMTFGLRPPEDPVVSPLLADLGGLPPVWITAATNEVLLDDTLLLSRALALSGVPCETSIVQGLFHLWPLWPEVLPKARTTLDGIAAFVSA